MTTITANERPRTGRCATVIPAEGTTGELACPLTPGHKGRCAMLRASESVKPHPLAPVYNWLVDDIGFPFNWSSDKPGWLDVRWLAEIWRITEGDGRETTDDYVNSILYETGWSE